MELGRDKSFNEIAGRLETTGGSTPRQDSWRAELTTKGVVKVAGTWGSFARLLAVNLSKQVKRPILYICPHIDDADNAVDDLQTFGSTLSTSLKTGSLTTGGATDVQLLPAWEGEEEIADATDEIRAHRLRIVARCSSLASREQDHNVIIVTSIQAISQAAPTPKSIEQSMLQLEAEGSASPEKIIEWLVSNGFERVDKIDLPGQFARRGGIIDIYAPLLDSRFPKRARRSAPCRWNDGGVRGIDCGSDDAQAIRVDFFGDTIESIRQIDLDTQRSTNSLESAAIVSVIAGQSPESRELFLNILPEDSVVILDEPADCQEVARVYFERAEDKSRLYDWPEIHNGLNRLAQLEISRFATGEPEECIKLDIRSVQQYQHKSASLWAGHKEAIAELVGAAKQQQDVLLYCEAEAEIARISEIIMQEHGEIPRRFKLLKGFVHQGFAMPALNTIIISHHELFGQFALRRRTRPMRQTAPIDTLEDLQQGDYVVHTSYGIGKYIGSETIREKDSQNEYLTIEYDGGVKVQVSVNNIALVQKYIGTSPGRPKLSKVGSKRWLRQKEKVEKSVKDLAVELLDVQARRQAMGGFEFSPDTNWQREFEGTFPYQETPDQTTTVAQIKQDMGQPTAMDRLLCGDVGYGKTELAMRAAFKAVENGKQAAVLVPTTVLSVQHARTFIERFADFPVVIEALNRFRTAREAKDIIERTGAGKVDILIGTHRLLSGDVKFKDLGLVIIDEEQRFGVEHKEKLKKLRVNVDILTMTATPIPRTLHMAMLGLRDISSLATAPLDRRSIVTTVTPYSEETIRKAIIRELNRQGQVFFVHNRVKTIDKKAWEIQKLAPDAKVAVAHGQMAAHELEQAMIDFVLGKTQVLVCTTIIESGLDIPNANTMLIDDADRFGLAELHQLRGRVGRYKHRAYAYMLLPASRPITPIAARRLKAIEEYSHLGAGFRIALRDLEIRGAGNILGAEQSGHIQMVGYQMYCELLANAVRHIKGESVEQIPMAAIDLGLPAYIPKNYIPADRSRMDAYRRIATAKTAEELKQLEGDFADVYGPLPAEVKLLLDIGELRIAASKSGLKNIVAHGGNLELSFADGAAQNAKRLLKNIAVRYTVADETTVYLHLAENYFEQRTLIAFLRKLLGVKKQ
ncbi:MAG: transcription-repair coupling factor [Sedimentisphaerales bacterium]|nr:transcription-repair coupling factor [Sedimentisphaerales bacterium]